MSFFSSTTVLVGILLLYLSSFLLFAIIRIATGVSIQRIGYFSLRRIAYAPREGIQIEVRGLGLSFHRPSFSQPTWITFRLTDPKLTIDPRALKDEKKARPVSAPSSSDPDESTPITHGERSDVSGNGPKLRTRTWTRLTKWKDRIKRLHSRIQWLALFDLHVIDSTIHFVGAGQIQLGSVKLAVDTRQKMVQRGRMFRYKKRQSPSSRPVEWMINVRNILLAVDGQEPVELLDHLQLNIHGHVYRDKEGLRDASIALKLGRLFIPSDDLSALSRTIREAKQTSLKIESGSEIDDGEISFADYVEELDRPGSREDIIMQTVADSREFVSSLLRGIEEIQLALSFFRISRSFYAHRGDKKGVHLNLVTHEVGMDLHRMNPNTPAHRMYFQSGDVAHQALLAAISISVSLDDNAGSTDRLLYVPMATTTVKTTLPSKTVTFSREHDAAERNSNVLFSNLVITSPALDLEPRHLSQILHLVEARASSSRRKKRSSHHLILRLLPKASIKLSVHEPVLRLVLPITADSSIDGGDYNLLISSVSSISLDVESSHSPDAAVQYSLSSTYRITSHQLYYQTVSGAKHNILQTQNMEVRVHFNATSEVLMAVSGNLNSFSVHLVNEEVTRGIKEVMGEFQAHMKPKKVVGTNTEQKPAFLRRLPAWLAQVQFEATELNFEVAGAPPGSAKAQRGVALQLESWTADYRSQNIGAPRHAPRRRTSSHSNPSLVGDDPTFRLPTSPPRKTPNGRSDGRRLVIHVRGLEGFALESEDYMEPESFLSLPRWEVAFTTQSDLQGPIFHVNSVVKALYLEFSLYRCYSIGVAASVLGDTFISHMDHRPQSGQYRFRAFDSSSFENSSLHIRKPASPRSDLTTVDVRFSLVQVKGFMPSEPPLLLQVYGLAAGKHRWSAPFVRCQLARLHVDAPKLKGAWARLVTMNSVRVDFRESKRKHGREIQEERSIDLSADFIRVGVPHNLVMHRIFDNFINTVKALKQLRHRFRTNSDEDSLERVPEGPKILPRISLRSRALAFQLEDDAFEWKLGCIYRAGLVEQKHRLAREEAFRLKSQKLKKEESRRSASRYRGRFTNADPAAERKSYETRRSASTGNEDGRSSFESRGRPGQARYDAEGSANLSSTAKISEDEAWLRLQEYNARNWKAKVNAALQFQSKSFKELSARIAEADEPPEDIEDDEVILALPNRPSLMSAFITDAYFVIDKPSFPVHEYPQFLHRVGKGMPLDMQYALLVPMSLQLDMGEARVTLRDYPLDFVHVPALRPGQSPRLPSLSLKSDFVIAEEFRNHESTRDVQVCILPPTKLPDGTMTDGLFVTVRRTVSPVKTYSEPAVEINTSLPTCITWCMSYQPVIQDMMKIFEGFTKPEIDPSERVGFWDKIRLSFHSRIKVRWKGDGDVHLRLKGSRDPYIVTGFGAGFVMCWRKDVQWDIHPTSDPKELMAVTSGEYVLAVPDYSQEARYSYEFALDDSQAPPRSMAKDVVMFKKVLMKLSGSVKWLAGLMFERNVENGRSFEFKPHYEVVLKHPNYIDEETRKDYDAFRGFRSNHIHLSLAVMAPTGAGQSESNYNTVHLTPRIFTHFFNWWSLFSGSMSLPVRQGRLWPGITKTNKKFGRHLATVKYKLLMSPLFVSHIYKHKDAEDYGDDVVTATGLKVRLANFKFDLHQRREQIVNTRVKGRLKPAKASAMRINRAELDFEAADFRAVSATIEGTDLGSTDTDDLWSSSQQAPSVDLSRFTIPDEDLSWIDMDDFVELDWILPQGSNAKTEILPLAYTPRFTYFRQTDHDGESSAGTSVSPFGTEPTHDCVMAQNNDPRRVQMDLFRDRLANIEVHSANHERVLRESERMLVQSGGDDHDLRVRHELLLRQAASLARRRKFVQAGLRKLEKLIQSNETHHDPGAVGSEIDMRSSEESEISSDDGEPDLDEQYAPPDDDLVNEFYNRFTIHNPQVKWNNSLRNIILRYIHQVGQRRGFMYYMSRQAVKFIIDIVEEQAKNKQRRKENLSERTSSNSADATHGEKDDADSVEDRIEQFLHDAKRFVSSNDSASESAAKSRGRSMSTDFSDKIPSEYTAQNSYHLRMIAPQIQLQSDKNPRSVTLVAAKEMTLKVLSIMDKRRVTDDVSGLVQRRFTLHMDGAQFFVATQKNLKAHLQFYAGNKYGNPPGSAWPPWLALEAMFDFGLNPFGFSRIIQRTSASLRYDKFNNLRLKYNDELAQGDDAVPHPDNGEGRMDQIWVDFPNIQTVCDSTEYYTMYIIVLDLLLYSEPLEKVRSERLEKIMLASDFSDLRGAPEMVFKLQERIRQLEEIKEYFQIQARYLDRQGLEDRLALEKDLANCEDELFFIMKAITTSQRRTDDRTMSKANAMLRWRLSASDVVWHLMRSHSEPLVEFQLGNVMYERTDNSDGSNYNQIEVERLQALNLLKDAVYPQMIVPYEDHRNRTGLENMTLRVQWYMLEAVAGIPVLDDFEVSLSPLKVQLERELGKKLFEYIFPGIGSNAFENGGFSPFMIKHMKPLDMDESDGETTPDFVSTPNSHGSVSGDDPHSATGPGSIELRLQPTLSLGDLQRTTQLRPARFKGLGVSKGQKERDQNRLAPTDRPTVVRSMTSGGPLKKKSMESLRALTRSSTEKSLGNASIKSSSTDDTKSKKSILGKSAKKEPADDLTQMMSRASNYMILAHVKINDVVLCLSYKGKGERNIEDIHNFVFRLPVLEYRNKTWSNLELALRLKKDVIKALISHAPAILGNKISHPRPSKQQQQRLRELASSSQMFLPSTNSSSLRDDYPASRSLASRDSGGEFPAPPLFSSMHRVETDSLDPSESQSSSSLEPSVVESDSQSHQSHEQGNTSSPSRIFGRWTGERPGTARSQVDEEDGSQKNTIRNLGRKFLHRGSIGHSTHST